MSCTDHRLLQHHQHHPDHHQFPSIDTKRADGVFLCPVHNSSVLFGSHDLKLSGATFWKSPYNGVVKVNSSVTSKHQKSGSFSGSQQSSSDSSKSNGHVKGILKKGRSRDSESDTSSMEEDRKLRGILARGDSADAKRATGKRVKFDDKLVRLHEIGRRFVPVAPWAEARYPDEGGKTHNVDAARVLREISVNRQFDHREMNVWSSPRGTSAQQHLLAKSSTTPDLNNGGETNYYQGSRWQSPVSGQYRLMFDRERVSSARSYNENIRTIELEKKGGHPRLCRSFTSPMLLSHKSPRKTSAQNMVIYRHEINTPDDRNSSRSVKSAGNSPRQRVVFHTSSVQSERSDTGHVHANVANFCNDDKTNQIVRWLRNVNDTRPREGRCTVFLPLTSHDLRES